MRNPIMVTLVALALATLVNAYYFTTGSELTTVVSRTLFVDLILVLSLVPIYLAILIRNHGADFPFIEKVKAGMKPVAMYTFLLALITFGLMKAFGDPLIAERMDAVAASLTEAVEANAITAEQKEEQLAIAAQIYSPSSHVLIILLFNLFVGFVSSILAGMLVKK